MRQVSVRHVISYTQTEVKLDAGGSDAPELNAVLLNIVINGLGIAGTSWLFRRDLRARQRDRTSVQREEALARLQVECMHMFALQAPMHVCP